VDYPEHEKLRALDGKNDVVGDFIEWLREHGYVIARYGAPYEVQAFINTKKVERGEDYDRIQKIRREVRDGLIEVGDPELFWLTSFAIRNDLVEWSTEMGAPGDTGVWGNEVFLGEQENPSLRWVEVRHNEDKLWDPMTRTEALLGEYFEIDQRKLSEEKDAMLAAIRS
jgi:hypothetical protein